MKELVTATIALLLSLFYGLTAPSEEEAVFRASGDRAKEYITYLASDELQGRQTCTEGYRRAADWVAMNFEAWKAYWGPSRENRPSTERLMWKRSANADRPLHAQGPADYTLEDPTFGDAPAGAPGCQVGRLPRFQGD